MVLLSQMMRTAAITGRPDQVHAWFADRQSGRWAEQLVRDAYPTPSPSTDREQTERELTDLHERGVLTDEELERLRARLTA